MSSIHYSHCPEQDIWTAPAQLVQRTDCRTGQGALGMAAAPPIGGVSSGILTLRSEAPS